MRPFPFVYLILLIVLMSCSGPSEKADLLLVNATIYTVDDDVTVAQAIAIRDGRILATGTAEGIQNRYEADKVRDLSGAFVYPGWIDAHCHFFGYGMNLRSADLVGTEVSPSAGH